MNITVVFFSQTGNTRKVAEAMGEAFRDSGHATRLVPLRKATAADASAADLFAIGSPCFACQAPTPVKQYLESLPDLAGQQAFVFATSGGAPGRVLSDLARPLAAKGASVRGGFLARGELFYPAPCLKGRFKGRPDADDLAAARGYARSLAEHLAAKRPGLAPGSRPDTVKPGRGFYDYFASMSPDSAVRSAVPAPTLDPTRCNKCRWCEYACPMNNITLSPYPVLGSHCVRCYRCSTGCPKDAFHSDWRFANLFLFSVYNETFARWFGDIKPGERVY